MRANDLTLRSAAAIGRSAAAIGCVCLGLSGCESALTPFVGQSKEAAARSVPAPPPPAPPPTTAFVNDAALSPGFAGQGALAPTLPTTLDGDGAEAGPSANAGPRKAIAAVPLSAVPAALAPLSAAANRARGGSTDMRFILLVLSPPATDAAALDRNSTAAREAAAAATKVLGDGGIAADHIDVSLATSPTGGTGELRLYPR